MNLYHYCSNNTFYKIINTKELWMTDISRSNDYDEMKLFIPGIYWEIEDLYRECPFSFKYKNGTRLNALRQLLHEADNWLMTRNRNGFLTSYVVCFSKEKDLLSQWRGYADNARGCSIGFSLDELESYCSNSNGAVTISKVHYIERKNIKQIIRDKAKELLPKIISLRDDAKSIITTHSLTEEELEQLMQLRLFALFEKLLFDSLCYKWDDFREENEWRMYFKSITKNEKTLFADEKELPDWQLKFDNDYLTQHNMIEFFAKEDCIVPYYPLKLKEISPEPIKTVLIGPKNNSYIQDIRLLFAKEKLGNPDIKYSNISYR